MATPNSVIQPIQKVQNTAVRLILRAPHHQSRTPLLQQLHWLPISERIKYKTACMCYNAITGSAPSYLSEHTAPLQSFPLSPLFIMQTHACSNSNASHFLTFGLQRLEQSPPKHDALGYSLFLQKQTRDLSLLRIFQLSNTAGGKKKRKREREKKCKPVSKRIL